MSEMVRLGDVCEKGSSNIAQKDLEGHDGDYPIYGASGFIKNVDFFKQNKEYIAVVKDGAGIGRVMKLPAKSSIIGTLQYIIPCGGIDIGYLAFAMENMNLAKYFSGATIPHIYFKDYSKEKLLLPPLPEQRRIAAVLDKVSELIALRKRQLDLLDEMVKARFVEMFGDLIVNNLNWSQVQLSNVATTRLGKMLDAKKQTGKNTYPYLANFNVQWFQFKLDNLNQMDFDESDQIEFALEYGDLLVCEGGEVGRCAVWKNQVNNCFFQKALHRIRCDKSIIIPDYLAWWFKVHANYNSFDDIVGSKATIPHLTGIKLKQLMIEVPPIDLQNQFADFVQQVDKSKATVQQGLDRLNLLKSALMQEYFG